MRHLSWVAVVGIILSGVACAQAPEALKPYVSEDAPVLVLKNVRVIDGTGAPARADQTVVIRNGLIAAIGPTEIGRAHV